MTQPLLFPRLMKNRCPKCNKALDFESDPTMMMCTISCGFMITVEKMSAYCAGRVSEKILLQDERRDEDAKLESK